MKRIAILLLFSSMLFPTHAEEAAPKNGSDELTAETATSYWDELRISIDELLNAAKKALAQLEGSSEQAFSSVEQGLKKAEEASQPLIDLAEQNAQALVDDAKQKAQEFLDEYEQQFSEEFNDYLPDHQQKEVELDLGQEA